MTDETMTIAEYAATANLPFETCRRWALRGLLGPFSNKRPRLLNIAWLREHGMLDDSPIRIYRERLEQAAISYSRQFPPEQRRDAMIEILEVFAALAGPTDKVSK